MLKYKIWMLSIPKIVKIYLIISFLVLVFGFFGFIYQLNEIKRLKAFKKVNTYQIFTNVKLPDSYDFVTCTIYNPCPEQGWGNGDVLYDGTKIKQHSASGYRYVSVSEDLLKRYPIGCNLRVYAFEDSDYFSGVWTVKDKMHSKKRNHIDFLQKDLNMKLKRNFCFIKKVEIK